MSHHRQRPTLSRRSLALLGVPVALVLALGAQACETELSDVPFSCAAAGVCPEGFTCEATVCVRDGVRPEVGRPMRVSWINSGEMYWFPSPAGGADLVVNDGFSEGGRALYQVRVAADGRLSDPVVLLDFGEQFPTSSAVVVLDDSSYGVLTLSFPSVESTEQELGFYRVPRDGSGPPVLVAQPEQMPRFVGGAEPAYVSAVVRRGGVDVSYADPAEGGRVIIGRIDLDQGDGQPIRTRAIVPLSEVLPLSADTVLWDLGDALALRVGFETNELWRIPDGDVVEPEGPLLLADDPVYAFPDRVLTVAVQETEESATLAFELYDWQGALLEEISAGPTEVGLVPYTGVASGDGALFAPVFSAPDLSSLEAAVIGPDGGLQRVASIARPGSDDLYEGRALRADGRVYFAWTAFHGSLMDLWVGVAPEGT